MRPKIICVGNNSAVLHSINYKATKGEKTNWPVVLLTANWPQDRDNLRQLASNDGASSGITLPQYSPSSSQSILTAAAQAPVTSSAYDNHTVYL